LETGRKSARAGDVESGGQFADVVRARWWNTRWLTDSRAWQLKSGKSTARRQWGYVENTVLGAQHTLVTGGFESEA